MDVRTVVREANARDIEPITTLALELAKRVGLAEGEVTRLRDRIYADLTAPSPSTYWIAFRDEEPAGAIKESALGPGFDTLIGLDWLATAELPTDVGHDIASRLVAASLGSDLPVSTWVFDDVGAARAEKLGFALTGVAQEAPDASLAPGVNARQAIRR